MSECVGCFSVLTDTCLARAAHISSREPRSHIASEVTCQGSSESEDCLDWQVPVSSIWSLHGKNLEEIFLCSAIYHIIRCLYGGQDPSYEKFGKS